MNKLQVSSVRGDLYSQEIPLLVDVEEIVGKYEGKPLYRKTISGTKVSGTTFQKKISDNIENVLAIYGSLLMTKNGHVLKFPLNYYENNTVYIRSNVFDNNFQMISGSSEYSNGDFIATILYTKTTD
jgi:hypothetical protein